MRCPGCIPGRLSLGLLAVWVAALVILHAVELSQELHWSGVGLWSGKCT